MIARVIVIPGPLVGYVRAGLQWRLGYASQAIAAALIVPRGTAQPASYTVALAQEDRSRALLNVIGWEGTGGELDVAVNLYRHGEELVEALRLVLDTKTDLSQLPHNRGMNPETVYLLNALAGGTERCLGELVTDSALATRAHRIAAEIEIATLSAWSRKVLRRTEGPIRLSALCRSSTASRALGVKVALGARARALP